MKSEILQGQVDRCIDVFLEAAHWGRRTDKKLWSDEDLKRENLLKYYKPSEFYLIMLNNKDAGAMVIQWEDPVFWPDFPKGEAGYLHKLCIRRAFSSIGLSDHMIQIAISECKKRNIGKLRLDTGWKNTKLRELYERNGFKLYDQFDVGNGSYFARYELEII